MPALAVFPLSFVRDIVRMSTYQDHKLADRFGYIRAKRMRPAVHSVMRDMNNVHCGSLPLVGQAWISAYDRFNHCRTAYVNTAGGLVFPA